MMQLWSKRVLKSRQIYKKIDTIKTKNTTMLDAFSNSNMSDDEKKEYNDFNSLLDKYTTEKDKLFELLKEGKLYRSKN